MLSNHHYDTVIMTKKIYIKSLRDGKAKIRVKSKQWKKDKFPYSKGMKRNR